MKKVILILVCCVMFIASSSCNKDDNIDIDNIDEMVTKSGDMAMENIETEAYLQESKGLEFVSNGDGTCYVSSLGNCADKDIVFPTKSPYGDIVTSIANHAFYASNEIQSIIVSNSITRIGAYAFSECSNLSNVILSDSVVVLGQSAFSDCEKLESITMSRNIVDIEDYTFYGCKHLKSITLYRSIYSIGYEAFYKCSNLENIIIPNSVSVIEGYAFAGCDKLTSMIIPNSVTDIGGGVFAGCTNLAQISVENENPCYFSKNNCIISGNEIVATCNNFTIPNDIGITSIGEYAISHISATNITIPKNITNIEFMAITGCSNLKNIFYEGTTDDWNLITKNQHWFMNNSACSLHYMDGMISTVS